MAKKKVEKPKREFTKRQLSRWQQHKRRQRIIFGSGILIVVAVLTIIGLGVYFGWYAPEYKPLHETIVEVNGNKFNMDYYIKTLEYKIFEYESFGFSVTIDQLPTLADAVVTDIEEKELIRQAAEELGITVSDDEVDEKLDSYEPPLSEEFRDLVREPVRAGMLRDKLLDEYFEEEVPKFAYQRHIMAMFLESESQVNDVKDSLEAGEDFAELASGLSLDTYTQENGGDLGWRVEGVLSSVLYTSLIDEYAFNCEVGVLSEPLYDETRTKMVGYWLIEILERPEEWLAEEEGEEEVGEEEEEEVRAPIKVRLMLFGSEQDASEIRDRLEAGEDFAELANEFSLHSASKDDGGEFEISSPDMMPTAFSEYILDPEVELGTLSQPIRDDETTTSGGYWLVEVTEEEENREIEEEDRAILKADALDEWIQTLWDDPDNDIVSYLDEEKKLWVIAYITGVVDE